MRNTFSSVCRVALYPRGSTTSGFSQGLGLCAEDAELCADWRHHGLGVNLQWGFAGLFNIGVMGFVALGGLATVLVSMPTTPGAWSAGGWQI